ncbi:hypothetical protein HZS_5301 [Henneguya salminicola]|nr:hypothetical protein HZS_5301 [Henneguya salminicola]
MRLNVTYIGFSYNKINKSGKTIYYRCRKSLPDKCEARLIFKNDIITVKGNHSCKPIQSTKTEIPRLEISPEDFVNEYINEKASRVNLNQNSIYQELLMAIRRDKFKDYPYNIPSKDKRLEKIKILVASKK